VSSDQPAARAFVDRLLGPVGCGNLSGALFGETFSLLGVPVCFTQAAVVMAVVFVAGPFYLRQAIASFGSVDADLLAASRTLGAGPARTFWVALPLAIYAQLDIDFEVALGISALLVLIDAAVLLIVKLLPSWTRSGSTSAFPFARSGSS